MDTINAYIDRLVGFIYGDTELFVWIVMGMLLLILLALLIYARNFRKYLALGALISAAVIWGAIEYLKSQANSGGDNVRLDGRSPFSVTRAAGPVGGTVPFRLRRGISAAATASMSRS